MCGIYCHIRHASSSKDDSEQQEQPNPQNENGILLELLDLLSKRGPDSLNTISIIEPKLHLALVFTSSVLSLRGPHITPQPLVEQTKDPDLASIFCWNGEAWRFNGQEFSADENDGHAIFNKLLQCHGNVAKVIELIEGPFAFVFYDRPRHKLWFGRDWLGRRSLLKAKQSLGTGLVTLCSVSNGPIDCRWDEVEADGIYCIELTQKIEMVVQHIPFLQSSKLDERQPSMIIPIPTLNLTEPEFTPGFLTPSSTTVLRLYDLLSASLRLRVKNIPERDSCTHPNNTDCKVGILFSGGLDCTVLARLVHDLLPLDEPVELFNVAFENKRVVNGVANEMKKAQKKNANSKSASDLEVMEAQSPEAIIVSPYDLCPDRVTGLKSFEELQSVCPGRAWKLVKIDVPYEEVLLHRSRVLSLIFPHETEMDFSIGLAFYFAARPIGLETNKDHSRILLSGLGADELFGGYARHGTSFLRDGYKGLLEELQLDLGRLGKRNLGRDDRVISNWSREARFPYLDEQLLKEVIQWRVEEKCDFGASSEEHNPAQEYDMLDHEKKVLRLLAWKLGMKGVAKEKKRAVSVVN